MNNNIRQQILVDLNQCMDKCVYDQILTISHTCSPEEALDSAKVINVGLNYTNLKRDEVPNDQIAW